VKQGLINKKRFQVIRASAQPYTLQIPRKSKRARKGISLVCIHSTLGGF
jgi:hypothetical protein